MKKAVKRGLTQRIRKRVGMDTDSDSETDTSDEEKRKTFSTEKKRTGRPRLLGGRKPSKDIEEGTEDGEIIKEADSPKMVIVHTGDDFKSSSDSGHSHNVESEKRAQDNGEATEEQAEQHKKTTKKTKIAAFQLPKVASAMTSMSLLEQHMPADAVLAKEGAAEVSAQQLTPCADHLKNCRCCSFCKVTIQLSCHSVSSH